MNNIHPGLQAAVGGRSNHAEAAEYTHLLRRLTLGARIGSRARPPESPAAGGVDVDTATISYAAQQAAGANRTGQLLGRTRRLLTELRKLVGAPAAEAAASTVDAADRRRIASVLSAIDRVAKARSMRELDMGRDPSLYTTSGVAWGINDLTVDFARLPQHPEAFMTVRLDVLVSAQTAEVYLSTGAALDPDSFGSMTLEIESDAALRRLSFVSGTSQANIIAAINAFTAELGVSASQNITDANRVELRRTEYGDDRLLRVEVLSATGGGLRFLALSATAVADAHQIKDVGRDVEVLVNGAPAEAEGLAVHFEDRDLALTFSINGSSNANSPPWDDTFCVLWSPYGQAQLPKALWAPHGSPP